MLAQLGSIRFEGLKTFDKFAEAYSVIMPQHARINTKPGLQMTGANLDTKTVDIQLHNAFCDVVAEITALKDAMNKGEIMPLVMGDGRVLGNFCIGDISVDTLQMTPTGTPLICNVSFNIVEYYDVDEEGTEQNAAADSGIAVQDGTIKPLDVAPPAPVDGAGGAAAALVDAKVQTDAIDGYIDNADNFADQANYWFGRINDGLDAANDALNTATEKLADIEEAVDNITDLYASILSVQNFIEVFKSHMPPSSIADLRFVNGGLQSSVLDLRTVSGNLNGLAISRQA